MKAGPNKTPIESAYGKTPSLKDFRVFGCRVEYWILNEKRDKLNPKTKTGMYLGTSDEHAPNQINTTRKGFRILDLETMEVIYSRDVTFYENEFPYSGNLELIASINTSYREAMASDQQDRWKIAIEEELRAHQENEMFETIDRTKVSEGVRLVGTRWVFTEKMNHLGEVEKLKARLVAQGYQESKAWTTTRVLAPRSSYKY